MRQRRRYRNPPIDEAVCEFRFHPSQDWDLTIPGRLHGRISDDYPGKPRQQKVFEAKLEAQGGRPPSMTYGEGLAKVQLVTEDGTRMVGVGHDVLSVHMLRPYQQPNAPEQSGWDEFRPRVARALEAYWEVTEPLGVGRIGIRYINKIIIPEQAIEVADYFVSAPPDVSGVPDRMSGFASRVEYVYDDEVRLVLTQGTAPAPSGHVGFLLDIDVIWESEHPVGRDKALIKAEDLRTREREAFEALITDKARELFDAD